MLYVSPPRPFVRKDGHTPAKTTAKMILSKLKDDFWNLDILTILAANDSDIYALLVEEKVIDRIKEVLLDKI
jgi:hypothetical protein